MQVVQTIELVGGGGGGGCNWIDGWMDGGRERNTRKQNYTYTHVTYDVTVSGICLYVIYGIIRSDYLMNLLVCSIGVCVCA